MTRPLQHDPSAQRAWISPARPHNYRAQIARTNLDSAGYELVEISINTGGGAPVSMRGHARKTAAEVAQPEFESGSSELSVHVNGTIELH